MQRLPLATNSINLVHQIIITHHEQVMVPGLSAPSPPKNLENIRNKIEERQY